MDLLICSPWQAVDRVKICGGSSSNFQYKGTHVEFSHPPDVFASFMKFANSRCVTSMFSTCPEKRPHRKSISDPNLPLKMATKLGKRPLMLWCGCFFVCLPGRGGKPLLMLFWLIDFQTSTILQSELQNKLLLKVGQGGGRNPDC